MFEIENPILNGFYSILPLSINYQQNIPRILQKRDKEGGRSKEKAAVLWEKGGFTKE